MGILAYCICMLRIRLIRVGKKNTPMYRLAVLPQRTSAKSGRFLELLGNFDPARHVRNFKKDRIEYWLSKGAKPSDTVWNMLVSEGVLKGKKIAVHKRALKKAETEEKQAPQAASAGTKTPDNSGVKEAAVVS